MRQQVVRGTLVAICAVIFAWGGFAVFTALTDTTPPPTPVPEREFAMSPGEALALDRERADQPLELTGPDPGPHVRTSDVGIPDDAVNHLYVPSIYVSAPIVPEGVTARGEMSVPEDLSLVGWLDTTSSLAAREGSTLLAGHVTAGGNNGTLYHLGKVRPGASVTTLDSEGLATEWVVTEVRTYHKQALPSSLFETTGDRFLTLVTCGGRIIQTESGRWTYEDNIVVRAAPRA